MPINIKLKKKARQKQVKRKKDKEMRPKDTIDSIIQK